MRIIIGNIVQPMKASLGVGINLQYIINRLLLVFTYHIFIL
jgi:hypothetical protein